jgi:hypothetical protein
MEDIVVCLSFGRIGQIISGGIYGVLELGGRRMKIVTSAGALLLMLFSLISDSCEVSDLIGCVSRSNGRTLVEARGGNFQEGFGVRYAGNV